jgi:putative oxidoreductase
MERWLGRYSDTIYALLRIVVGLLFACHGAQKVFGALGGTAVMSNPKMATAGVIELGGGLLIAIGLLASFAAFVASGEMAYAYFTVHFPNSFWPIVNKGELAVVYCFLFLYIASRGAGPLSLDRAVRRKR